MAGWYAAKTRLGGPSTVTSIPQFFTVVLGPALGPAFAAPPQPVSRDSTTTAAASVFTRASSTSWTV
jgi:hypothetical protein